MKSKNTLVRFGKMLAGFAAAIVAILASVSLYFAPVTVMASSETGKCLVGVNNKTGEKIPCDQALQMRHDTVKGSYAQEETMVVRFPNGMEQTICKRMWNEAGEEIPCPSAKMPEPFR